MKYEIEVKFKNADLASVRRRLAAAGGVRLGRRFERNEVFDDAARSLRGRGVLLRLRDDGRALLTIKAPVPAGEGGLLSAAGTGGGLKIRQEYESGVTDLAAVRAGLLALGYEEALAYEKVREEWSFMDCHVCLDRLSFGDFLEVEGEEEAIRACAAALELDPAQASAENYHTLHARWRAAQGLSPQDSFVFVGAAREEALALFREDFT
ncbi:adenylate cyclase [Desulfovibrio sp. X2]|uniref:class IV adenylate cyclase n=1 Tax=Desulfovibrio sp. X2 TaxID=941449 RepID=UPI000358D789|nr:class IV adenylate cyclase [Desulfovibrio sp. X2]EPR44109.1 adenylate cyclase [Desulfovibrio sp. X2]